MDKLSVSNESQNYQITKPLYFNKYENRNILKYGSRFDTNCIHEIILRYNIIVRNYMTTTYL